ncbi:MAG: ATP-binding cassette domain-containing protein [Alphaproteobacteria bacterium]|nr:ATP-binding cassette domain-containing protein [Alphaproteobacteria bacterium]
MMGVLLSVRDLQTSFFTSDGEIRAVDGVTFDIDEGATVGLVGESGCGKSVTALSIMRLLSRGTGRVVGGEILYRGENLAEYSEAGMRRIRGNEISMIFQEPMTSLNPVFTIGEQIGEAVRLHQGVSAREARNRAVEMLRLVKIAEPEKRIKDYPHQLSGGMRQRVMIAIALSCNPRLLMADEPTTALDVTIQAQILDLIGELQERLGMAVLLITHDLGVVAQQADDVAVMYAGRIVERAKPEIIFSRPMHPYTVGLMNSVPGATGKRRRLEAIPGIVPSPLDWPSGCRFRTRCTRADDACAHSPPELVEVEPGHWVSCLKVSAADAPVLAVEA